MTFVFWAALALAGFVVGPVVAHLLRRGRAEEREFPAASLVPALASTARQRSRLEDWTLLVLRSLLIVGLAVLGAAPLVRCERLSLARTDGGSVALALVLDDSLSMRSTVSGGRSRWDAARDGALELLRSARDGDSVTLVLAGRPARVALAPTSDLGAARRALDELGPSDRPTDLAAAAALARAALRGLPQKDHRLVVLSDLSSDPIPDGIPPATAPLPELARPAPDCAITSAERRGSRVAVAVACNSDAAARARTVEVVVAAPAHGADKGADAGPEKVRPGDVVAHADVMARSGEQTVAVDVSATGATLDVRLSGQDASSHDDTAPVSEDPAARRVAVVADAASASAKTGGPTIIEQAVDALSFGWTVQPLPLVPDDEKALAGAGALVIDDPRGFSPEAREAIGRFVEQGGVALALLGPRAARTGLGWTLEPFARGAARWEAARDLGIDAASISWLGPEATSLGKIGRSGRIQLDGMEVEGARVLGTWTDGVAFLLERRMGRGVCLTAGLPVSLEASDLALRPGFLALVDHVVHQADLRKGSRRTVAGATWSFPEVKRAVVEGPEGPVAVTSEQNDEACAERADGTCSPVVLRAVGAVRGRYQVRLDGTAETRAVVLDPGEVLAEPHPLPVAVTRGVRGEAAYVGASREVALAVLLLLAAEVGVRLVRRWAERSGGPIPG